MDTDILFLTALGAVLVFMGYRILRRARRGDKRLAHLPEPKRHTLERWIRAGGIFTLVSGILLFMGLPILVVLHVI
jgi:hypothetical protein